jgi:hypothetical protein
VYQLTFGEILVKGTGKKAVTAGMKIKYQSIFYRFKSEWDWFA